MLRASLVASSTALDLGAIVDPSRAPGPPGAAEILDFTRALVRRTPELGATRNRLRDAIGDAATAAVAGSVGNFEMMNRLLDATGVPTPSSMAELTDELRAR